MLDQSSDCNRRDLVMRSKKPFFLVASAVAASHMLPTATAAAESQMVLEEIIVTAQKRAQNLQDVPVSMTAFSAEMLDEARVISMADVASLTPNFSFLDTDDSKYSVARIRGVFGNVLSAGGIDQPTAVYVDEVYLSTSVAQQPDLFDIERIEVLRGPQGTLFGRNTIAGAISIHTAKPTDALTGYVESGYGNYNAMRLKGSVSGPLGERAAGRISALYNDREGYETNRVTGNDVNNRHDWGVRAALRVNPTDRLELNLATDFRKMDQGGRAMDTGGYNLDPAAPVGPGPGLLYLLGLAAADNDGFDRSVAVDFEGVEELDAWGASLTADLAFEGAALKSISAFRTHDFFQSYDLDITEADINRQGGPESVDGFSQELRLTSTGERKLDWILGLFYYNQKSHNEFNVDLRTTPDSLALVSFIEVLSGLPAGTLTSLPFGVTHTDGRVGLDSYAAFAHTTWHATDKLDLVLGGRYTYERKSVNYFQSSPIGNQVFGLEEIPFQHNSDNWSAFTPTAVLSYDWTDDVMTYATISKGFKSGGFSDIIGSLPDQSFRQEITWNYEVGFKTAFAGRKLVLNGALFQFDWQDQQGTLRVPQSGIGIDLLVESTIGDVRTRGLELELTALPFEGFGVGARLGLLDGEYTEVSPEALAQGGLRAGDKLQAVPDWSAGLSAHYGLPLGGIGQLRFGADYDYRDELLIAGASAGGSSTQEAYGLLNATIGFESADERWSVLGWGKNLTDEEYVTFQVADSLNNFVFQTLRHRIGAPRTYGVDVRYRF
ncbi:MAG: TonB-dependent receptor [Steroidobacteraceae bacterium]